VRSIKLLLEIMETQVAAPEPVTVGGIVRACRLRGMLMRDGPGSAGVRYNGIGDDGVLRVPWSPLLVTTTYAGECISGGMDPRK